MTLEIKILEKTWEIFEENAKNKFFKDLSRDEAQLAKIISESSGVIDEKSLRTWDSKDVLVVYDSLVRAHESINKLALVLDSF